MKHKIIILLCTGTILLGGCSQNTPSPIITESSDETTSKSITELTIQTEQHTETTTNPNTEQSAKPESVPLTEPSTYKESITDTAANPPATTAEPSAETIATEESATTESPESDLDDTIYIGEYLDSVSDTSTLEIAKGDNHTYQIQIAIFRLTFLDDCIGELTAEGMNFTGTDAAGNPISGIITVEEQTATVTFTYSTWSYLENGTSLQFTKSSDIPNLYK